MLLGLLLFISGGAWITSYFGGHDSDNRDSAYLASWSYYGRAPGFFDDEVGSAAIHDHGRADGNDWLNPPQTWWRLTIRNVEANEYVEKNRDRDASQYSPWYRQSQSAWYEEAVKRLEARKSIDEHIVCFLIYLGAGSFFALMSYLRFCLMRPRVRPTSNWLVRAAHPALRR
jgi:hypothetical protein